MRNKQLNIEEYFQDSNFDHKNYLNDLEKPRKLLGKDQFNWIKRKNSDKFRWSIFGQQILIGPKYLPKILKDVDKNNFPKYLHKYI